MRVTVILKDFSDQFFDGAPGQPGFMSLSNTEKFTKVNKLQADGLAKMKIGRGNFADRVELNQLLRQEHAIDCKVELRRGYKLASFDIRRAPKPAFN